MQNEESKDGIFGIVKSVALALLFSFLTTVIFAVVLRAAPIPDKAVYPITQVLKVIAIILGTLAFTRGEKGWLKGGGVALIFTALSYVAYSALGGVFTVSWFILVEVLISLAAGVLSGILAVNLKR